MTRARPWIAGVLLLAAAAWLAGLGAFSAPPTEGRLERLQHSLAKAVRYLLDRQSADGAWRSDTYGTFKDGTALTPLALTALDQAKGDPPAARRKAAAWLAAMAKPDGTIAAPSYGLDYPLYTAAGAVVSLSRPERTQYRHARDAWLAYLRQRQLTEELGWRPDDKEYGGWGYCRSLPRKPRPNTISLPLIESNLSATLWALVALRAANTPADDPGMRKAFTFVVRCQNWQPTGKGDARFDDGGFYFIYDDPVRNKAGILGRDAMGRPRFASYGSTTADGLRALVLCGRPTSDARVRVAQHWLIQHFKPGTHPGTYAERLRPNQMGVYFYYCASLAQAFCQVPGPDGWAMALANDLIDRQRADGSWTNPVQAQREDDPITATAFGLIALSNCRAALAGK